MLIDVTQFLRPNGCRTLIQIEIKDELKDKVKLIQDHGCTFTAETLRTGEAALYITYESDDAEGDVDIYIGNPNKADKGFEELIERFTTDRFNDWKDINGTGFEPDTTI